MNIKQLTIFLWSISIIVSPVPTLALPTGAQVVAGAVVHAPDGSSLTIDQQLQRAIINWEGFSIGAGEQVTFNQPGTDASILNRVTGGNLSEIYGTLSANGQVLLINPNGIVVGQSGIIDTHSFIASTLNINDDVFLAGDDLQFYNAEGHGVVKGTITNLGQISASGGDLVLIASRVENEGTLSAAQGTVGIAAGYDEVLLADSGNRRLLVKLDSGDWGTPENKIDNAGSASDSGILNKGQIDAVRAELAAQAGNPFALALDNEGAIAATGTQTIDGEVWLVGNNSEIHNTGNISATDNITAEAARFVNGGSLSAGTVETGGSVAVEAGWLAAGDIAANGSQRGGDIRLEAEQLILGGTVSAASSAGQGGTIVLRSSDRSLEVDSSRVTVSGATAGGNILHTSEGSLFSSGRYDALAASGIGGRIDLTGERVSLLSAQLDASGKTQGGLIRIGGAFQGGKVQTEDNARTTGFVSRWGALPALASAENTFINDSTQINVSSTQGAGGTAVVWSDALTRFAGGIDATGLKQGGFVEISAKNELQHVALADIHIGAGGELLLDPKNITVATSAGGWTQQAILGKGYTGGKNIDMAALDSSDRFGTSLAFDADGDRLAVGASLADGFGNAAGASGDVYLFSFSDTSFSGGALEATVGKGYTGGKNIDVTTLSNSDGFGYSVALDADGNRLAVGASNADGSDGISYQTGEVFLFSFSDTSFSGGALEATVGKGYTGGKNINMAGLDIGNSFGGGGDRFGSAVALNADGSRLAVGARSGGGSGDTADGSGEVYLFSFSDTSFSGGTLEATVGKGYAGGKNIDVSGLDDFDSFGWSVSLDSDGDRMAVSALSGRGFGNVTAGLGDVYLFTFTDTNFSGGALAATVGKGYTGGKNIDVSTLEANDRFGTSVSLDGDGDRLAVGTREGDGFGNATHNSGEVYLYSFNDTSFSGGTLAATIGKGYTGGNNADVSTLDVGDSFGTGVSLTADGTRLAVGAWSGGGSGNAVSSSGEVFLFDFTVTPTVAANDAFAENSTLSQNLQASDIVTLLSAGTAVTLQASNDITVNSAITANNGAGNGGVLTLQAGRSVILNESITTDNGNLIVTANETAANGVVDAQRDAGAAAITLAAGKTLNAGTGNISLSILEGTGITNASKGAITLNGSLTGATITANAGTALSIGATTASGNLNLTSGGTLGSTGTVSVGGSINPASTGFTLTHGGTGTLEIKNGAISTVVDVTAVTATTTARTTNVTFGGLPVFVINNTIPTQVRNFVGQKIRRQLTPLLRQAVFQPKGTSRTSRTLRMRGFWSAIARIKQDFQQRDRFNEPRDWSFQITPLFIGNNSSEFAGALAIEGNSGRFILPAQRTEQSTAEEGKDITE